MHRPIGAIGAYDIGNHIIKVDVVFTLYISGVKLFVYTKVVKN